MGDIFEADKDLGETDHVDWGSLTLLEAEEFQKGRCTCDKNPY
jgi:hypothetical protein